MVFILACALLLQEPELPKGEQELLQYALKHKTAPKWPEADRAYRAYLERFPKGERVEDALMQLGYLHLTLSGRRDEAREWFLKAADAFPKSANAWPNRILAAQAVQIMNRDLATSDLRKIMKDAPTEDARRSARETLFAILQKSYRLAPPPVMPAGAEPSIGIVVSRCDVVMFRVYQIPWERVREHFKDSIAEAAAKAGKDARRPVQEWKKAWTVKPELAAAPETVTVPVRESGVYLVEAEHDGDVQSVVLVLSRYELLTQPIAGKLYCLVQERAGAKPAAGATVELRHPVTPVRKTTDERGRCGFEVDGEHPVVATMGEEILVPALPRDGRAAPALTAAGTLWSQKFAGKDPVDWLVRQFPSKKGTAFEVIADEAAWRKAVAALEQGGKLTPEALEQLKAARPDFSKELLVPVLVTSESFQNNSRVSTLRGVFEEGGILKVWVHTRHDSGGTPPPRRAGEQPDLKGELRFLKLTRTEKRIELLSDDQHVLHP